MTTKQQKADLTAAVALYAQVTGLTRFTIRASKELTAKAVEYRRQSMEQAARNRAE